MVKRSVSFAAMVAACSFALSRSGCGQGSEGPGAGSQGRLC
jgi:hypothetical protein